MHIMEIMLLMEGRQVYKYNMMQRVMIQMTQIVMLILGHQSQKERDLQKGVLASPLLLQRVLH